MDSKHMHGEVDVSEWEECKAPTQVADRWKCKWRISPEGEAYHVEAERYFPGRGTWHQEVVISALFIAKAKDPGVAIAGLLHTLVPNVKDMGHGIYLHEN